MEQTTKKRGWFGRAVTVLVVWVALAGAAYYLLVVLPGGRPSETPSGTPAASRGEASPAKGAGAAVVAADWTPERIAEMPTGFVEWALGRAEELAGERRRRLDELARRRSDVGTRADALRDSVADVKNVHDRMERAYRNAEDEDRWPVRVMGRSFDRAKAESILRETRAYLDSREPLAADYAAAVGRLDADTKALAGEAEALNRLSERLRIDLERIRLDAKSVPASELQKAKAELDAIGGAKGEDGGGTAPTAETKSGASFLE